RSLEIILLSPIPTEFSAPTFPPNNGGVFSNHENYRLTGNSQRLKQILIRYFFALEVEPAFMRHGTLERLGSWFQKNMISNLSISIETEEFTPSWKKRLRQARTSQRP